MSLAWAACWEEESSNNDSEASDTATCRLDTPRFSDKFTAEITTVTGATCRSVTDLEFVSNAAEDMVKAYEEESAAMLLAIALRS